MGCDITIIANDIIIKRTSFKTNYKNLEITKVLGHINWEIETDFFFKFNYP